MLNKIASNIPDSEIRYGFEKLTRLVDISLILNSTLELDNLLQNILDTAAELLECNDVSILLYDENREELRFVASTGSDKEELEKIPVPLDNSLAGTIFTENRHLVINSVEDDPRHYAQVGKELEYKVDSLLGVPMRVKNRVTGVLEALNKRGEGFSQFDVNLLLVIASQAAIAINNAKLIQDLKKANVELSEADDMKRSFMAVASHELRTPLGIILGYATFLQDEASGESRQYAEQVLKAALRLRGILDDMKNMNLLYTGKTDLVLSQSNIHEIIDIAKKEITPTADAKNIKTSFELPSSQIPLRCDKIKLGLVFVNLLSNAIKFTPSGGEIKLKVLDKKDNVLISIQDNGRGIPPEKLDKIFEDFYQVENHLIRESGGLGVGLSIARKIVELHGGKIWAESEGVNLGSVFYIRLPLSLPSQSD